MMANEASENSVPTQSKSTKVISWKKIILTLVVILAITGPIAVAIWYYVDSQTKQETTPVTTAKVSTESAKQSTTSAQKDETADWKTYTDSVLKFSIKHPKDWTISTETTPEYEVEIINYGPSETRSTGFSLPEDEGKVKLSITKGTKSEGQSLEDYVTSKESSMTTTVSKKEITVDGRRTIKRIWEQAGFGTHVTTYVQKDSTTVYILTEFLHYQENLYDLLLSTFKFLSSTSSE
ncbi:MAG: PsbP-related protein [Candidatus Woykebacteria bacterium]